MHAYLRPMVSRPYPYVQYDKGGQGPAGGHGTSATRGRITSSS